MSIYTEHFETVFGKKQNIRALQNKVLKLAIQGKLVAQDPDDEPASELVRSICEEKVQLISGPKRKKTKLSPNIEEKEIPYEIPFSWTWARLSDVLDVRDGTHDTPRYVSEGIPLVTSKNLKNGKIDFSNVKYISELDHINIEKRSRVDNNDILFAMIGTIGNAVLVKKDNDFSIKNMALFKNYPNQRMNMPYVKIFLDAMEDELKEHASGGVQSFLSLKYFRELLIPIPPICEQTRIVARVEALISNVYKLDYCLERKEKLQEAIPKAVVSAISNCQNEEELKVELTRVIEYFTDIFQTPDSLQELRDVIIQLGIQGKLLPHDPNDEPASKLLERIEAEKEQLIQDKRIKKEKLLPEIEKDDIPFETPDNWEWVKLGTISNQIHYGYTASSKAKGDAKLLRITDIQKGKVNWNNVPMCDIASEKLEQYLLDEDDIVIARTGGTIGKSFIIRDIQGKSVFASYLIRVVLTDKGISDYIYQYLYSPLYWNEIQAQSKGTGQPNVNAQNLKNLMIPMPPLEEQYRIVAKIESLMKLIDQMESKMSRKVRLIKTMATV